jgi:Zn-dependent membrane protease YugP
MFFGFDPTWILLMIVSVVLGFATQGYINSTYRKWSRVPLPSGMTGAQVAARVLENDGLSDSDATVAQATGRKGVRIQPIGGSLTDNYDPRNKTLNLSEGVYGSSNVAAAGVAAHEAGHAIQDSAGYFWGKVRSSLVPVASFGSRAAWILIFVGAILGAASGIGQGVIVLGIVFYAFAVLFQLVTLPVEFDASRRAMGSLEATGTLSGEQLAGARQVLTAAALTYVAAALISVLQLFYLFGFLRRD